MASLLFLPIAPLPPARRRVAPGHTSARRPRMDVSETLGESLVRSAMLTDESSVRTLLKSGAPVSYASQLNASNMTALMWAASEGSASITQLLLSNDADVDAANAQGFTALLYAFENLTSSNPRAPPPEGYPNNPGRRAPPRQIPVGPRTTGHDAVCQLLVDAGADVRVRNAFGETLLHLAAKKAKADWVRRLVQAGVPVDAQSYGYLQSALHVAAKEGHADVATELVQLGADVDLRSRYEWTPVIWAAACANEEVLKVLIDAGADVNARGESADGVTSALDEARRCVKAQTISRLLIRAGAV